MKLSLLIPGLAVAALFVTGCNYDPSPIAAEAPGGTRGIAGPVPASGPWTLFHVTEYDMWGAPVQTEKVITLQLKANERVGFQYVLPPDQNWEPDAHSDVIAYAGSWHKDLGPIQTLNDHYYWANPEEWNGYWSQRPTRVLAKRATLY